MEKGGILMDLNTYKYEIYKDAKEKEDKKLHSSVVKVNYYH